MKKFVNTLIILLTASLFSLSFGQTEEKKVVIVKKIVDENGVETVEEITLEGDEAEAFDLNQYLDENVEGQIDIDVDATGTDVQVEKRIKIITSDEGTDGEILRLGEIIEGRDDISDEIKSKLKDVEIKLNEFDDKDVKIFKLKEGQDGNTFQWNSADDQFIIIDGEEALPEDMNKILKLKDRSTNGEKRIMFFGESQGEPKGFLGVWPGDESENGVSLGGVEEGSAADKAGLKEGDVITSIEGTKVSTFSELAAIIGAKKPGDKINIEYSREGTITQTVAELGERKKEISMTFETDANDFEFDEMEIEIDAEDFEEHLAYAYKFSSCCNDKGTVEKAVIGVMISEDEKGVLVEGLNRENIGLQANDVIYKFDGQNIASPSALIKAVEAKNPGDKVKIHYYRDGKKGKAKVTLGAKTVKACCAGGCCSNNKQGKVKENREIIIIQKDKTELKREIITDEGVGKLELQEIDLYPNPNNGTFTLTFSASKQSPISISITDVNGKEVIRDEIRNFDGKYTGEFKLEGAPGVYFVNIIQEGRVFTEKVVLRGQ